MSCHHVGRMYGILSAARVFKVHYVKYIFINLKKSKALVDKESEHFRSCLKD